MTGLYVPGDSLLHRMAGGVKLAGLFALGAILILIEDSVLLGCVAVLTGLTFTVGAGLSGYRLWHVTRPLLIWLVFIFVAQAWLGDPGAAVHVTLRILALVWAAALVTHTTRMTDMTAVFVRAFSFLRRFGASPERLAFLCALTIRLVPALFETLQQVREAHRARGIERSYFAVFVPVLIRVLKQADTMSDALIARGFDRWDEAR